MGSRSTAKPLRGWGSSLSRGDRGIMASMSTAAEAQALLVEPSVQGMSDLRGCVVDLGTKADGVREMGLTLVQFAG